MSKPSFYVPPKAREKLASRVAFMAAPSVAKAIEAEARERGEGMSDVVRRAVELYYNPRPTEIVTDNEDLEAAPLLDVRVACGSPMEAREDASPFVVTKETADEVGLSEGGFWIRTRGDSMEGGGILDEFLVCLSPLKAGRLPRRGDIALIELIDEEGNRTSTLKRWESEGNGLPRLLDGAGNDFEYPEGTVGARAVAVANGVMGAL